jgi:DNA-directed RNA polymerase specialized sigma24 family protein
VGDGAEGSFELFVDRWSTSLFRTAYLLTGDRRAAADLLQETLVAARRRWELIGPDDRLPVLRRLLVTRHTGWRSRLWLGDLFASTPALATLRWPAPPPVREERDELTAALGRLAPRTRAVLVLRFGENLSAADTADLLGCATATVTDATDRGLEELDSTGSRLGRHLAERAGAVSADPAEVLTAALDGAATQRGHRLALGMLAAVLIGVALLVVLSV